jgi:RimJ/RimL family protein N-acetyltransferase
MPFNRPWTDVPSPQLERNAVQWGWRARGTWTPEEWSLGLMVLRDGEPVGVQGVDAKGFAVLRTVSTGSWLGHLHQGQGIGREMRAAVLHLAFGGLGAQLAVSSAFEDNPASAAVSRALHYEEDGWEYRAPRGQARVVNRYRLTRERWEAIRRDDITIEGLDACLELFGAES